ncbi:hypothetical protein GCM10022276_03040 [Sphingomonas limnosediminicola]|uniref:Uncharacterized protein n=1 Tax=Sphingomonas limnosediminicola TaxID=940133 RepID=A0ABP7KT48_9SPHN
MRKSEAEAVRLNIWSAINPILWVLAGAFAGPIVAALPIMASVWGTAGCAAVLVLNYGWHTVPAKVKIPACLLVGAFVALCIYKGVREYTGANYPLKYRVCGAPSYANGYVDGIFFGLEWVNPNKANVNVQPIKRSLNAGDRHSKLPLVAMTVAVHPSGNASDDPKTTDYVAFDPPLTPKGSLSGDAHYEFKIGPDPQHLRQDFVVDGMFSLGFTDDQDGYRFEFSPTGSSKLAYVGECDISTQIAAQPLG